VPAPVVLPIALCGRQLTDESWWISDPLAQCAVFTRATASAAGVDPGAVAGTGYSRALLDLPGSARSRGASDADLDQIIAGRARRQEIIREPGRRWQFVIGEPTLWSAPGGLPVQEAQLDHLVMVRELPSVELGVVPLRDRCR
jgi:hypothetical protein